MSDDDKKMITYHYKDVELEDYSIDGASEQDKKIVRAQITGDYSEIIETKENI